MENKVDLTICQDCKINPAVYGDGLTWSRCSKCQLKLVKEEPKSMEQPKSEGFKHEIKEGLTSIIIPVYMNSYTLFHYTGNCIGSVREHTDIEDTPYEIVIIDNGSPIQPPSLNSYYANRIIKNTNNLGVTKAWNQGIRISQGEYIVLLNNDVQVFEYWLKDLKEYINGSGSPLGGYDLVMAHPMYSLTEPFARAVESRKIQLGLKKLDSLEKDFSCVMFKRSLIDEIGLFDERFFSYCSDSDFFKRMEEAGKKWKMVDRVATSHISDATGFSIPETGEIMNKDKAAFKDKWEGKKVINKVVGNLIRTKYTGDAIFFVKDNKYHHIKNPETLKALGFNFGDEKTVDLKIKYEDKGERIDMANYKNYV